MLQQGTVDHVQGRVGRYTDRKDAFCGRVLRF